MFSDRLSGREATTGARFDPPSPAGRATSAFSHVTRAALDLTVSNVVHPPTVHRQDLRRNPTAAFDNRRGKLPTKTGVPFSSSVISELTPVALPPGRFRAATRPNLIGSPPVVNTMGTVAVAASAACAAGVLVAAMTATLRTTRSAASAGSRS